MTNTRINILFRFFICTLALTTLNITSVIAEQSGSWAIADMRLLMVLHPHFGKFDYSVGKFLRESAFKKERVEVQQEMNKAWEEIQPEIRILMTKQSRLLKERFEVINNCNSELNVLIQQPASSSKPLEVYDFTGKASASSEPETFDINKKNGKAPSQVEMEKIAVEAQKKLQQKLSEIDEKLALVQDEFQSAHERAFSPLYLTASETDSVISEVLKELSQLISQVAEENSIKTVLDTSYAAPAIKPSKDIYSIPVQQDASDLISSNLFHSFTNWDNSVKGSVPMADGTSMDYQTHVAPHRQQEKLDSFRHYLDFHPYLNRNISSFSSGNIFLLGGNDITPLVAQKIFDKYQIPENLKASLLQIVKEYKGLESPQRISLPVPFAPPVKIQGN
ncbi:MAG: hypothetical protein HQM10_08695 [Candidatus Riflebacteria bacterium]|nr:hypothetical protein [Candidatus Riflebacteria bacterium]